MSCGFRMMVLTGQEASLPPSEGILHAEAAKWREPHSGADDLYPQPGLSLPQDGNKRWLLSGVKSFVLPVSPLSAPGGPGPPGLTKRVGSLWYYSSKPCSARVWC